VANKEGGAARQPEAAGTAAAPVIRWDDANMANSYANVCNVIGTREEIALYFGMSVPPAGDGDLGVALSQRVLMSPFAAKRLAALLSNIISQYESRWGSLGDAPGAAKTESR
jgi:hypothetical protein